jgi:arylsulfatase
MGFSDVGCYGSEIRTPNLDRIAERGIRYTNFTNCARCCPTRASLLTGLYPHQAGVGFMTDGNRYNRAIYESVGAPEYHGHLNRNCVTIAEALGQAGYQTFMSGKWHVGTREGQRPTDRCFERFYGILGGACNYWRPDPENLRYGEEPVQELPEDFYTTDYFTDYAVRFVEEAEPDRPFFLYVAYNAPHWPLHAWPEDIERYRGTYMIGWDELRRRRLAKQKEMGLFGPRVRLTPRDKESYPWEEEFDREGMDLRMATYAAMVDRVDRGIGRILAALREAGREENTLIMFLSDNGGCAEPIGKHSADDPGPADSFLGYLLPWANASNTPFRLFKHWVHEGGIATPFIVCWPDRIDGGVINTDQTGHVKDVMPTCLEAAGARYPGSYGQRELLPCEGRSLLRSFLDPESVRNEPVYWEHEGNRAVRDGRWKLVSYYNEKHEQRPGTGRRTGRWQLYDLATDRTELNDLAGLYPEKARELREKYEQWALRTGVIDWEEAVRNAGLDRPENL